MSDPLIGKKLGDYTIQGLLGRGGMSRVYRGYDENLDRYAAVKVISGDFVTTAEDEYTRRFQIEARSIARLRHPNIVGVYQFGRSEGIYYMAMVFLEGRDLRTLLKDYAERNEWMPFPEMLRIVRDVAGALDYAHEQGVIHRDIKPSNIILERRTGRAILMDFGLALSVHEGTTGDTFGSAHYIAPEQAVSSAQAVAQSDLYSLGIVIYEMLAGKVPFDDPSAMSVALKHINEIPAPLRLYNPSLPAEVEQVISRLLEKEPARRYATGRELVEALESAFGDLKQAAPPAVPVRAPMTTDSRPGSTPTPPPQAYTTLAGEEIEESESAARLAQRFARRKARKEEEAARQELGEAAYEIDEQSLDSLLDSYEDPRDLGLVGPDAKGITLPERPSGIARPGQPAAPKRPTRRSRFGLLLTSILVLTIVIVGGWFGLVAETYTTATFTPASGRTLTSDEQTARALVVAASQTAATQRSTVTNTPQSGTEETAEGTAVAQVPSPSPTPRPSATATRRPTQTSPLSTNTATTSTPVAAITEVATEITTETPPEPTATTPAPSPTATARPTASRTPGQTPSSAQSPNLRLTYNDSEVLLVNISGQSLDVSGLIFQQERADGSLLTFEASLWASVVSDPAAMAPEGCYQLITSDATRTRPERDICPALLGWFRSNRPERYFWISDAAGSAFAVYNKAIITPVVTCEISAGMCEFYLPPE